MGDPAHEAPAGGVESVVDDVEFELSGHRLRVETVLSSWVPPDGLVSAAFAMAFDHQDRILLVRLADRDWHPTGGHREPGEAAVDTAVREAAEEGGCRVRILGPVGLQRITMLDEAPEEWPYPLPTGYQVFFSARIEADQSPRPGTEATEAALFAPAEARALEWVQRWSWLYEAALGQVMAATIVGD
ncbi:MAG TPA: NUDIX domain-containing protein [Acidimicrobiales bacterium]|nr:NUDIX domain-containing protein [Acidimicrobiales bacterium]